MNHAHSTHYTDAPNPGIKHVLRGWSEGGGAARTTSAVCVMIRNVPTNIRDWGGGTSSSATPSSCSRWRACAWPSRPPSPRLLPGHLKQLGRIDVLLVPVDGSYTMDIEGMMGVMEKIHAPIMIPMHYFGQATLERFLARVGQTYPVERPVSNELIVSRATLPPSPKIVVLPGR